MTNIRKTITAAAAAMTLGGAALATTVSPAAAQWGYGGYHAWGAGPVAAGVIGGLALGAVAAGAAGAAGAYDSGYGYGCVGRTPVYDAYGNFAGYRRVRVAC